MAPALSTSAGSAPDGLNRRDVCVIGVARTPIGALLGSLSSLPATKLGSVAVQGALRRANVDPALVQEVFLGNVPCTTIWARPWRGRLLWAPVYPTLSPAPQSTKFAPQG